MGSWLHRQQSGKQVSTGGIADELISTLTATISVPMNEKAAWVMTAHQPRNCPSTPGISAYCVKGPGFFQ